MNKKFLKLVLFCIVLIFNNLHVKAIDVRGYILNENQDTIFGIIQLNKIDQITGERKGRNIFCSWAIIFIFFIWRLF